MAGKIPPHRLVGAIRSSFARPSASRSLATSAPSLIRRQSPPSSHPQFSAPTTAATTTTTTKTTRLYSSAPSPSSTVEPPAYLDEGERKVFDLVKESLHPTQLEVQDVSGGCGSMYALDIVSSQFAGLSVIKQHRLVNKVLGEEIKKWHGVQLKTRAP